MYISDIEGLSSLVMDRRSRRDEIRSRINRWIEREYGLDNYTHRLDEYFSGIVSPDETVGFIARQTPSVCTEDCMMHIATKNIGLTPLAVGYDKDTHSNSNREKFHRVKLPMIEWSRKGNMILEYETISRDNLNGLDMKVLDQIETRNNVQLPRFHDMLREQVFENKAVRETLGDYGRYDISDFWSGCVNDARNKPQFVYRQIEGGDRHGYAEVYKGDMTKKDVGYLRPPASWSYPLYFSLFLDGSMVLLETYENPDGQVFEAKKLFEDTMRHIERQTGFVPLVLEVPHLSPDMMYCNRHIISEPTKLCTLLNGKPQQKEPLVSYMRTIANKVIAVR